MHNNPSLIIATLAAVGLQVAAVSTNDWACKENAGMKLKWGQYKVCLSGNGIDQCRDLNKKNVPDLPEDTLKSIRGLSILSYLLMVLGLVCCLVMPQYKSYSAGLYGLGAVLSLVVLIMWGSKMMKLEGAKGKPGYSLWLYAAGGLIAAVIAVMAYKKKHSKGGYSPAMFSDF